MYLDEIKLILEKFLSNYSHVTKADIDELLMLIEASESQFPARFLKVSSALEDFNAEYPEIFIDSYQRLLRILEVSARIPHTSKADDSPLTPVFTLKAKDKTRVIKLCADMRKIILASTDFDHPHKIRLANRIAAIEAQVHKENGMYDVIIGGVSDIGETLGKFGKDIKPLTDRINEVMKITRAATKEYDQIPAPDEVKQLPKPEDFEDGEDKK